MSATPSHLLFTAKAATAKHAASWRFAANLALEGSKRFGLTIIINTSFHCQVIHCLDRNG